MRQWSRWGLVILVGVGLLAACGGGDKGDPVKVSRDFLVALWTGDQDRVNALACEGTQWPFEGDSTLTIDTDHMKFEVTEKTEDQVEVVVSGVVTFRGAEGQSEVRNLDELGITRFVLRDEGGWKVCDIR